MFFHELGQKKYNSLHNLIKTTINICVLFIVTMIDNTSNCSDVR